MPSLLPTFHETLGAASVGFSISCGIFGILTTLIFIYFRRYPRDRLVYKVLVVGLWFLELVDQIFVGFSIYYYTITHFGQQYVLFLENIVWPLLAQVMIGVLIATIVKACFALRVWRFSHENPYITAPVVLLLICQLACGIAYCVRGFQVGKLLFADQLRVVASLSLGVAMATDVYIAVTLCGLLHRLRSGFKQSDTLINNLIVYAISTGAVTAIVSFACLLVYNLYPHSFYFMVFYFQLGKLYCISLVASLNTRKRSVDGRGTDRQDGIEATGAPNLTFNPRGRHTHQPSDAAPTQSFGSGKRNSRETEMIKSLEIEVHREVSVSRDLQHSPIIPLRKAGYSYAYHPERYSGDRLAPNRRKPS